MIPGSTSSMIFANPDFIKALNGKLPLIIASTDSLWMFAFTIGLIVDVVSIFSLDKINSYLSCFSIR